MINVTWVEIKSQINKGLKYKIILDKSDNYHVLVSDSIVVKAIVSKTTPKNNNQIDLEDNYLAGSSDVLEPRDLETGGMKTTNKFAPNGWLQRLHEIQFETATVGGNLHDKDYQNNDTGWSSIKLYEGAHGSETEITGVDLTNQTYLDTNCTRTDFLWMPNVDYMILSGVLLQHETPTTDLFMWGLFLDTDSSLHASGLLPIEVLGGGLNMKGVKPLVPVGLKGVSGSTVYYAGVMASTGFQETSPGMGTNRIRYIMRHEIGKRQMFQSIFEIFRE